MARLAEIEDLPGEQPRQGAGAREEIGRARPGRLHGRRLPLRRQTRPRPRRRHLRRPGRRAHGARRPVRRRQVRGLRAPGTLPTDAGTVTVGGRDIRDAGRSHSCARPSATWSRTRPVLAGTLRDNLLYAAPDATDDDMRDVVARGPASTTWWPGGASTRSAAAACCCSGGERQRVAIARALLRRPALLLPGRGDGEPGRGQRTAPARAVVRELAVRLRRSW
ncbi:ATP-binding cassette domain-containing protein [Streptomyces sp. KL116D]|uniref:ATP-binding cassette domain-containing protein n=1 Tax=Streptomyces sp. KL116D TaxID=3045152 RepID=UPI0035584099